MFNGYAASEPSPYVPCMLYLPTFARTKSPSFVGKYSIHGAYGNSRRVAPRLLRDSASCTSFTLASSSRVATAACRSWVGEMLGFPGSPGPLRKSWLFRTILQKPWENPATNTEMRSQDVWQVWHWGVTALFTNIPYLVGGWAHPSEKYESQMGWWHSHYMEK